MSPNESPFQCLGVSFSICNIKTMPRQPLQTCLLPTVCDHFFGCVSWQNISKSLWGIPFYTFPPNLASSLFSSEIFPLRMDLIFPILTTLTFPASLLTKYRLHLDLFCTAGYYQDFICVQDSWGIVTFKTHPKVCQMLLFLMVSLPSHLSFLPSFPFACILQILFCSGMGLLLMYWWLCLVWGFFGGGDKVLQYSSEWPWIAPNLPASGGIIEMYHEAQSATIPISTLKIEFLKVSIPFW